MTYFEILDQYRKPVCRDFLLEQICANQLAGKRINNRYCHCMNTYTLFDILKSLV